MISDECLIRMDKICCAYDDVVALSFFSAEIRKGETAVIMGPNGCGKSTLLKIMNGLIFPEQGEYLFGGTRIDRRSMADTAFARAFHQKLGYLFQNVDSQLFHNNVEDEIAFGPLQMGLDESEAAKRTDDMIRMLDIEKLRRRAPYHLSTGEKKKVALASILAVNPEVIVLDEPISGLDMISQIWITDFLKQMKKAGRTIVIATHNEQFAEELEDRRITMTNPIQQD